MQSHLVKFLAVGFVALLGCHPAQRADDLVQEVLRDFVFVMETDGPHEPLQPHGDKSLSLPNRFAAHRAYVFHRALPNVSTPVWQIFVERMRQQGLRVISAPHGAEGLIYSYIGGPFFVIRFQFGDRQGFIQNQLDGAILNNAKLSGSWEPSDYILYFEK